MIRNTYTFHRLKLPRQTKQIVCEGELYGRSDTAIVRLNPQA